MHLKILLQNGGHFTGLNVFNKPNSILFNILPSWASYGMSIVSIVEKNNNVVMSLNSTFLWT